MEITLQPEIDGYSSVQCELIEKLGSGANADVYKITIGNRTYAFKLYNSYAKIDYDKLHFMTENRPQYLYVSRNQAEFACYSWPLAIAFSTNGNLTPTGYITPLIDDAQSFTLDHFYDHILSQRLKTQANHALSYRLEILINLCSLVEDLHASGGLFVDFKPQNIRVYEGINIVSLLDCDGFTIKTPDGRRFPATMYSPDYTSPEVLKSGTRPEDCTREQDHFALAVIVFQMLNYGLHPYQGVTAKDIHAITNDEKAMQDLYPYGRLGHPKITPSPASVHETFDDGTRAFFDRAFDPVNTGRPSAQEWRKHLEALRNTALVRCDVRQDDVNHIRFRDKPCPACRRLAMGGANPSTLSGKRSSGSNSAGTKNVFKGPWGASSRSPNQTQPPNTANTTKPATATRGNGKLIAGGIMFLGLFWVAALLVSLSDKNQKSRISTQTTSNHTAAEAIRTASMQVVCGNALNSAKSGWNTSPVSQGYVREAERRGLTVSSCVATVRTPQQGNQPMLNSRPLQLTSLTDVCTGALNAALTDWDQGDRYREHVKEAKLRAHTVASCAAFLRPQPSPAPSPLPVQARPYQSASNVDVCRGALNGNFTNWDDAANYREHVHEARLRNYTITYCAALLRQPSPQQNIQSNSNAPHQCDFLAANPNDPSRHPSASVPFKQLGQQASTAVQACRQAVNSDPRVLRFRYQLGRALEWIDRSEAMRIHHGLVNDGYGAAFDNLGWIYIRDRQNFQVGVRYFLMGAVKNDPDSLVSVAMMIDQKHVLLSPEIKVVLYRRAADRGHQTARSAYDAEVSQLNRYPNANDLRLWSDTLDRYLGPYR